MQSPSVGVSARKHLSRPTLVPWRNTFSTQTLLHRRNAPSREETVARL